MRAIFVTCISFLIAFSARADTLSEYSVLSYVQQALGKAGKAGRINYAATCGDDRFEIPTIPTKPVNGTGYGFLAVRNFFGSQADVRDENDLVRITIGNTGPALLQTRISHISLTPFEQYNAELAVGAIEQADEFKSAVRRLRLRPVARLFGYILEPPSPGKPHLPRSLDSVTAEQALDLLARTFKVVVLYGYCHRERLFDLYSVPVTR